MTAGGLPFKNQSEVNRHPLPCIIQMFSPELLKFKTNLIKISATKYKTKSYLQDKQLLVAASTNSGKTNQAYQTAFLKILSMKLLLGMQLKWGKLQKAAIKSLKFLWDRLPKWIPNVFIEVAANKIKTWTTLEAAARNQYIPTEFHNISDFNGKQLRQQNQPKAKRELILIASKVTFEIPLLVREELTVKHWKAQNRLIGQESKE